MPLGVGIMLGTGLHRQRAGMRRNWQGLQRLSSGVTSENTIDSIKKRPDLEDTGRTVADTEDPALWQPRGSMLSLAQIVEIFLPDLIISNMERITGLATPARGLDAFIEHSKVVREWDVPSQRTFGGHLLRQTVPAPLATLFGSMLSLLRQWPDVHEWAIRFGASTFGAIGSRWLVGDSRVLSQEEERLLVQQLRSDGVKVAPTGVMMLRKCKFIEESGGCKNLCLNLCKAGTEEYMTNELGFPVRLVPNLVDHSCAILLMEDPIRPEDDPLFSEPCGAKPCDQKFSMPSSNEKLDGLHA